MKIAAGIIALIFGISSLGYVGIFGGSLGFASSWLGSQFGSTGMQNWGNAVQLLCWAAPLLAIVGGALAFSSPGFASLLLGGSAACHWALLGTSSYGNLFGGAMAVAAVLALIGASIEKVAPSRATSPSRAGVPPHDDYDRAKWSALLQYDPEIAAAVEKVRPLGRKWVDEFARAYLALGDKAYLLEIGSKITARAQAQTEHAAQLRAQAQQQEAAARERRKEQFQKFVTLAWGTRNAKIVAITSVVFLISLIAVAIRLLLAPNFDERVTWKPVDASLGNLNCYTNSSPDCLIDYMRANGATSQAIIFTRLIRDQLSRGTFIRHGYAEKYFDFGTVNMVKVVFPFESQGVENEDFLLVNRKNLLNDPNDRAYFGPNSFLAPQTQPAFSQVLASYPNAIVWPVPDFDHEENLPSGGQRFVFKYNILNGCHACDLVGIARFAFIFDSHGDYAGASVLDAVLR